MKIYSHSQNYGWGGISWRDYWHDFRAFVRYNNKLKISIWRSLKSEDQYWQTWTQHSKSWITEWQTGRKTEKWSEKSNANTRIFFSQFHNDSVDLNKRMEFVCVCDIFLTHCRQTFNFKSYRRVVEHKFHYYRSILYFTNLYNFYILILNIDWKCKKQRRKRMISPRLKCSNIWKISCRL